MLTSASLLKLNCPFSCQKQQQTIIQKCPLPLSDISASSPYIAQELTLLKKAFNNERAERIKLQADEMAKILNNLTPIYVPQPKDNRIIELENDLIKVKHVNIL